MLDDDGVPVWDGPFAEFEGRRVDMSARSIDDGSMSLHLEDRRQPQLVVVGLGLGDHRSQHFGVSAESFECEAERRRGGLVSGREQGEQFVANVLARHRRTVFVGAAQHHRQHIGAMLEVRV